MLKFTVQCCHKSKSPQSWSLREARPAAAAAALLQAIPVGLTQLPAGAVRGAHSISTLLGGDAAPAHRGSQRLTEARCDPVYAAALPTDRRRYVPGIAIPFRRSAYIYSWIAPHTELKSDIRCS